MARKRTKRPSPIRLGVVGVGRGMSFARGAGESLGMKLVALCDTHEHRLSRAGEQLGVATYADFDDFLAHDLDAVVLANYFHEHAPLAIRAMKAGKHVMSETAACKTLAEAVELCRTVEQTGRIYMFAENYPYAAGPQEMRRLYRDGRIGEVRYAEGEYNHPGEEGWRLSISAGLDHWRNWLPPTYYCSHALAPLMYVTDTLPVRVNALSIVEEPVQSPNTVKVSDVGAPILIRMDNGAVFRILGLMLSSIHRVRYEVHGTRGLMAVGPPHSGLYVHHEPWLRDSSTPQDCTYTPDFPDQAERARASGHGGGDFFMNYHFAQAIRSGRQPYLNVYRATAMAAVGILGWRSCLADGQPFNIPNFRKPSERKPYADDHASPFPEDTGPEQLPPSIRGFIKPSAAAVRAAKKAWAR